jgi:hypothetical protein
MDLLRQKTRQIKRHMANLSGENQVYLLDPNRPFGESISPEQVQHLLDQEPYLQYQCENDQVYVLSGKHDQSWIVPKKRNLFEAYPTANQPLFTPIFGLLGWAFVGLLAAGLGTLVFAPWAAWRSIQLYRHQLLNQADQRRLVIALALSLSLLGVAFSFNLLFLLQFFR